MIRRKSYFLFFAALILIFTVTSKWNVSAESEKKEERKVITSFAKLEKAEYVYTKKPDVGQLDSIFPTEIEVMLEDQYKEIIPISWKAGHDLKTTDYDQYIFRAVFDEKQYIAEETKIPEIKVIIRPEEKKKFLGKAATYKLVEKSTKYNNGLLRVGYFVVETKEGRKHAFCAQHQFDSPEVNDILTESAVYTKNTDKTSEISRRIRKALYYGWGGPADIGPKPDTSGGKGQDKGLVNDASHFRRTALAASVANQNADNTFGYGRLFLEYLDKNYPDAPDGFEVHMLQAPRADNQDLVFYKYNPKGSMKLEKKSADPDLSGGNECYSFQGAEFGVYSSYNSATNTVSGEIGKLITNEKGASNTLTVNAGTYYVKELKAPHGFALSPEVKAVKVSSGKTTTVEFADRPQYAPVQILLNKVDAETNESVPQSPASLKNAEFTIKFYPGLWEKDKHPDALGKKPSRRWIFATDDRGIAEYKESHLIGGDALYKNSEGDPVLPLGTVTIQETKSPEGYLLNPELFIIQITPEGTGQTVNTYNHPTVKERILQLELVKWQEDTEVLIPGAEFEHIRPDGETEVVTTDKNGKLIIKGLQHGQHRIREISVMDGYLLNGNEITFEVDADNRIKLTSQADPQLGEIRFTITEEGQIRVEVEDKLTPFVLQLHKKNEKEKKLADAEFTLYEDKECKKTIMTAVTDTKGMLLMEGLEVGKKYYLKETKAPKGYRLPTDIFGNPVVYEIWTESIPVQDRFVFYVNGEAYDTSSEGMFTVTGTKADRHVGVTVVNVTLKKLPATGSELMIPTVVLALVLGFLSWKRR